MAGTVPAVAFGALLHIGQGAVGLLRDLDTAGVYIGFASGILGANAGASEDMVTRMFPMPPEEQGFVIKAIAYSGIPDWKGLLMKFVERMPARRITIDKYLYGKSEASDSAIIERLGEIATARGLPRAQIALTWLLAKPGVTAPIVGATKPEHLRDAIAALEVKLTPEEIARLEEPYFPHAVSGFI